jgi:hypothetical protein
LQSIHRVHSEQILCTAWNSTPKKRQLSAHTQRQQHSTKHQQEPAMRTAHSIRDPQGSIAQHATTNHTQQNSSELSAESCQQRAAKSLAQVACKQPDAAQNTPPYIAGGTQLWSEVNAHTPQRVTAAHSSTACHFTMHQAFPATETPCALSGVGCFCTASALLTLRFLQRSEELHSQRQQ